MDQPEKNIIQHIITPEMLNNPEEKTQAEHPIRDGLKIAGNVIVAGLIAGGAIASVITGIAPLVSGGLAAGAAAIAAMGAAGTIADAGFKIKDLLFEPQLQGA